MTARANRSLNGLFCLISAAMLALSGCAGPKGGDPGAIALPAGKSCKSVRAELNRLDAKGVPSRVEASQSGRKLPKAQQAEVERYNELLNQYLGARCHV